MDALPKLYMMMPRVPLHLPAHNSGHVIAFPCPRYGALVVGNPAALGAGLDLRVGHRMQLRVRDPQVR